MEPVTLKLPSPLPASATQPTQQQHFTNPPPQIVTQLGGFQLQPQPQPHLFHSIPGQQPQFGTVPLQRPMSGGPFTQPMAQSVFMPGKPGHFSVPGLVYADGAQHQFRPVSAPQMAPFPAAVQPPGDDSDDEAADEKEDTVVSSKTYAVNRQGILAKISLLLPTSPEAIQAALLFKSSWEDRTYLGEVLSVLRIENQTIQARFDAYKSALPTPNVRQRFHGTSRECDFCVDAEAPPCKEYSCALCSICAQSFSLEASGAGPNANNAVARALPAGGRYGRGLYFTRASSKANDYSVKVGEGAGKTRVVFLCEVAEGRSYEAPNTKMEDAESELATLLRARGQGGQYDSVVAEGGGDGPLNYHEVVVYDKDAVLPKYLIVYSLAE